jgi:PEP-CTERM motif
MLALGPAPSAQAAVIDGVSIAAGDIIHLAFTPLIGTTIDLSSQSPFYYSVAPGPYLSSSSVLGITIPGILSTGVLTSGGASNVTGATGPGAAVAYSDIAGIYLSVLGLATLTAGEIVSISEVHGDYGALSGSGSTTISGLTINGIPILALDPPANDLLFNALGITLVLNYQVAEGNGIDTSLFATYAVAALLDDVPFIYAGVPGLLNGSVILGGSYAKLEAVPDVAPIPEPAALALFGVGAMGLVAVRRKHS